jgi:hypothetical protein
MYVGLCRRKYNVFIITPKLSPYIICQRKDICGFGGQGEGATTPGRAVRKGRIPSLNRRQRQQLASSVTLYRSLPILAPNSFSFHQEAEALFHSIESLNLEGSYLPHLAALLTKMGPDASSFLAAVFGQPEGSVSPKEQVTSCPLPTGRSVTAAASFCSRIQSSFDKREGGKQA